MLYELLLCASNSLVVYWEDIGELRASTPELRVDYGNSLCSSTTAVNCIGIILPVVQPWLTVVSLVLMVIIKTSNCYRGNEFSRDEFS